MGVSEFVKRKLAMAYYRFDFDYDGVVSEGDFERLGLTVATMRGLAPGSPEADQIVDAHKGWWDAYFKGGDADGDGQVTLEEYLAFVDAWVGSDPDAIAHAIEGNELVFDTIDLNGDRKLTFEEFSLYLMAYGLAEDDAWTAFEHMDLDGDGFISRAEFAKSISEYYISEERPSPSEWFYGGHYRPPGRRPTRPRDSMAATSSPSGEQDRLDGGLQLDDGVVGEAPAPGSTETVAAGPPELAGQDVAPADDPPRPVDDPPPPVPDDAVASGTQRHGDDETVAAEPGTAGDLALLGGFVFSVGGDAPLGISADSQRLLAFLAVAGRTVTRNLVAATLWPEHADADAAARLRSTLSGLDGSSRHAVTVTADDLSLAEAVAVDFRYSRALARRLIDRGAALEEPDIDAFAVAALSDDLLPGWWDDWAVIAAEDWHQLRIHALEAVAARLTAANRLAEAAAAALAAVRAEPLRETSWAALIRVHLAEGNPSRTFEDFERYRVLLRAELDLDPTPRLVDLLSGLDRP
ncbi:MAG: hypothetical protein QOF81_1413 [Acidimicrobiaceae bacterium]|nr:hypothetical protein [Acidimicrobiaceae bacterium]